jgi:CRISPR-associated endonuclease/helicase Cas3
VSFGLIRMANIEPLVAVAQALIQRGGPPDSHIHLCVYHSQFPALSRSAIEYQLDRALDRRDEMAVFDQPAIRAAIDSHSEADQLFVVLGSPVTEVGRDHDYDWAIVEPSSMRSLIQLAGRVRRHRAKVCETPNLHVLHTNFRALSNPDEPAFRRPGFEDGDRWRLHSHDLRELLRPEEYEVVDARPRVLAREELSPNASLVDLEHARLRDALLPQTEPGASPQASGRSRRARSSRRLPGLNAATWFSLSRATLSGDLPRRQPFRRQDQPQAELILMPDEIGEEWHPQKLWYRRGQHRPEYLLDVSRNVRRLDLGQERGDRITPWAMADYLEELVGLAENRGESLQACAESFGIVTLPEMGESDRGWQCHPWLGFFRWQ